jgi:uncharacterized RDD family membrane protein YckC
MRDNRRVSDVSDNPYQAPRAPIDGPASAGAGTQPGSKGAIGPYYARVGPRVRAFLIDYFLLFGAFAVVAVVGAQLESVPGLRAALFALWVAFVLLYEPVMVSRTGGTLGHHLKNIHVVSDRTGGPPGFVAAMARNLIKAFLGGLSFLWMLGSDRQQAIHDLVARVTVQIKNPALARHRDYVRGPR